MQLGPKQTIDVGLSFNHFGALPFQDVKIQDNTLQTIVNCLRAHQEVPLPIQHKLGEQKFQQVKTALLQYHEWIWFGASVFGQMVGYQVIQETQLQRQLEAEAERIHHTFNKHHSLDEVGFTNMAWPTLEHPGMSNLSMQQQQEASWRSQVVETALYNGNPKLAILMHYAAIDEVKKVRLILESALIATPSPLLMTYGHADDHKKNEGSIANDINKINADIAALFTSDVAIQFLTIIRQDKDLIAQINQFTIDMAGQLAKGVQQKSLSAFQQMNSSTRQAFLKKFAEQKALTLKKTFS